jgi:hypothetical protein
MECVRMVRNNPVKVRAGPNASSILVTPITINMTMTMTITMIITITITIRSL